MNLARLKTTKAFQRLTSRQKSLVVALADGTDLLEAIAGAYNVRPERAVRNKYDVLGRTSLQRVLRLLLGRTRLAELLSRRGYVKSGKYAKARARAGAL